MLFPTHTTLRDCLTPITPLPNSKVAQNEPIKPKSRTAFMTWSAVDDVKNRASQLSSEAQKELSKASQVAQAKTGHIEPFSAQYYLACTFGGVMACV
jgi:solute carrier family 25 (mitochondrial phosphate transporter), member 3